MKNIGVSTASLICLPTASSSYVAQTMIERAAGSFLFFQGLAFRKFVNIQLSYAYIEDPWPGLRVGAEGVEYMNPPTWKDQVLFAKPGVAMRWREKQCADGAQLIAHNPFSKADLYEVCTEMGSVGFCMEYAEEHRVKLVYDTDHSGACGVSVRAIPGLVKHLGLVHIQPKRNCEEYARFLEGKNTELEGLLRALRASGYGGDYIIEVSPMVHNSGTGDRNQRMRSSVALYDSLMKFLTSVEKVLA